MKSKGMVLHLAVMVLTLVTGLTFNYAQDGGKFPYKGAVTGTNVYVRTAPDGYAQPVTKTNEPQEVTVYSIDNDDWLAIDPVPGCYSVIAQRYVEVVDTDKKTGMEIGKVTGHDVFVRPAGTLLKKDFKKSFQGKLSMGDGVLILGKVPNDSGESWYIIKPPKKVRYYISKDYVKPLESTPSDTTPPPGDTTDTDVVDPTAVSTTTPSPETAPRKVRLSIHQEKEIHQKIRDLEKFLVAESAKPVDKQDFEKILEQAKKIDVPKNSRWISTYQWMIDYTEGEIKLAKRRGEAEKIVEGLLEEPKIITTTPKPEEKKYDLQGVLLNSVLYKPAPGKPMRYYIRDSETRKILGYVQASHAQANLGRYVGKLVGIKGKPTFDENIAMQVLEVDDVDILGPEAIPVPEPKPVPLPEPTPEPMPVVKPVPLPEPTPEPAPEIEPVPQPEPTPEPVVKPKPIPVPVVKPKPIPVPIVKPKPVTDVKPKPIPAPIVKPTPDVKPKPIPVPVPPEVAEPELVPMTPVMETDEITVEEEWD